MMHKNKYRATVGLISFLLLMFILLMVIVLTTNPDLRNSLSARWYGGVYLGSEGVIFQDKQQNCGPAALMMVFNHFGVESSLREIEEMSGMSEQGTSMLGLKQMAEKQGLRAEGWRYTIDDFLLAPKPAVLFVRGDHFIVVDSISTNNGVYIRDPARGQFKISLRGLNRIWKGETLIFYDDIIE